MEIKLNEVEVTKLNLQPGETLVVSLKAELADQDSSDQLAQGFKSIFPNNKVVVLTLGENDSVRFASVSPSPVAAGCGTTPSSFCGDCNCGKREAFELTKGVSNG